MEAWLEAHADQRFLLFLHTYTVHDFDPPAGYLDCRERGCESTLVDVEPYLNHEYLLEHPLSGPDLEHVGHVYDAALRYTDEMLGRILAKLADLGLAERTVVCVTSDHGKELGERGLIVHGTTLYEELTRVPLILRVPGVAPRVVDEPVMLVDVAPTLLSALGLPPDERMQGRDLLAPSPTGGRTIWSEVDELAHKYAARDADGWKLIFGPSERELVFPNAEPWELYRLPADPGERDRLDRRRPGDLERMRELLEEHRAAFERLGEALGAAGVGELDDDTVAMLKQLGYL